MNKTAAARFALAAACAGFFLYMPIWSLLADGPFSWHVARPAAWQGGLEVVVLWMVIALATATRPAVLGCWIAGIGVTFYARRHGVDLAVLAIYVYVEGIFSLGKLAARALGRAFGDDWGESPLLLGLLGLVCWALLIWGASALGLGSPDAVRLLAVGVLGLALMLHRGPRLASLVAAKLRPETVGDRAAVSFLAAFCLALFAKASVVIDYDSLWYGLQASEVLVGEGSLYRSQGLVAVVHHYPKLYESLALPFAGLGSTSLVFGLGVVSWGMLVLTVIALLEEFGVGRTLRLWGGALLATLPALANVSVTAKGDVFSAWMLVTAMLALLRYSRGLAGIWLWVAAAAIALGVLSRLSNLPYAGLLGLFIVWNGVRRRGEGILAGPCLVLGALTGALVAAVLARTLLITGVALIAPNELVKLQLAAGMHLREPVGLLPQFGTGVPRLPLLEGLWGILFEPARYPHLLISWTANFWLFLPLAILILAGPRPFARGRDVGLPPMLLLGLSFFPVMFGYRFAVPAGDGNYFIVPIVAMAVWALAIVPSMHGIARRGLTILLAVFAVTGASISFVTGSWGPGTRSFDLELERVPFELAQRRKEAIHKAGLKGVDRFFAGMSPGTRVIGLEPSGLRAEAPNGWWLPVQYEPVEGFGWQNPTIVGTQANFVRYLDEAGIEYVVIPREPRDAHLSTLVGAALTTKHADGKAEIAYEDEWYAVWKLDRPQVVAAKLPGGGQVRVELDSEDFCARPENGIATVAWSDAPGAIAIEIQAPRQAGKLWAEVGGTGSMTTGPWMRSGARFVFKAGRDGEVLTTLPVEPDCR